jgi:hypothetical protein
MLKKVNCKKFVRKSFFYVFLYHQNISKFEQAEVLLKIHFLVSPNTNLKRQNFLNFGKTFKVLHNFQRHFNSLDKFLIQNN